MISFPTEFPGRLLVATSFLALHLFLAPLGQALVLAEEGNPTVEIFVSSSCSASVAHAARELADFLSQSVGKEFSLRPSDLLPATPCLVVGPHPGLEVDLGKLDLGEEGILIHCSENRLVLAGSGARGTLYAVYEFLETFLGYRWWTPDVSRVPHHFTLAIPPGEMLIRPAFEYRDILLKDIQDPDWCVRNRLNGHFTPVDETRGGKISYRGFVHTFENLVPPEEYYDAHPEYYSWVDGKRHGDRSQLCCSNPEVAHIVSDRVLELMRSHPEDRVFSVSQNDWYRYCECDDCSAIAEREGSQIGPILHLVNQVARAASAEFPNNLISTLAYQYSRRPPRHLRPEPNVIVRLCSIECSFAQPLSSASPEENAAFAQDLLGWEKVAPHLWVWNYCTSFDHYLIPYPNLRVRGPNTRFYRDHRVTGLFQQNVPNTCHGELSPLDGYLTAKLLWNPDLDAERLIEEFLEGVYGAASVYIREYLHLLHEAAERHRTFLSIRVGPEADYLSEELLDRADLLWDQAERAVADLPEVLERVRIARLSPDYAILERARRFQQDLFRWNEAENRTEVDPQFAARANRFIETADRSGLEAVAEFKGDYSIYREALTSFLQATGQEALPAHRSPVAQTFLPGVVHEVHHGSWESLPDFDLLTPARTGISASISLEGISERDLFGVRYRGHLMIPRTGVYTFILKSNDGSRLVLRDRVLIDHDGLHAMNDRLAAVPLEKGPHPFQIDYFESAGKEGISLEVQSVWHPRQPVSGDWLAHTPD
jgi:hypothetical protein